MSERLILKLGSAYCSMIFFICFFLVLSSIHSKCLNDQRFLLFEFRDGLHFDPTHSNKLVSWNQSMDCCKWSGVECNGFGHVISLQLDNELISVKSESWKALFNLHHLEKLSLAGNAFDYVTIPVELYNLTKLQYLNFSDSGFLGQIPMELSKMNSLVTLDLSSPSLEIKNPKDFGALFQNLTELRELYLDEVDVSAQGSVWCNAFASLSKLQVLSLRYCNLSGPISPFSKLTSLTALYLDGNELSTTVPNFFANFTDMMVLSLPSCNLDGQFPEKIFQIPTLESLDLACNEFLGGSLPQFLTNGSLKEINLSFTNFSGSLPNSIGNLRALSDLDLSGCNFSGAIPITLANLSELVSLSLVRNKFSGSIPSSLFALPSILNLLFYDNNFDGHIEEFPNASSSLLEVLDLDNNNLGGFIPKSFSNLLKLVILDLSYNSFSGTLRLDKFNRLQNLHTLDLSHNQLSIDPSCGTNSCLSSFPYLYNLNLASCNLKMFPDLQNKTRMIVHLDLSLNNITGEIPNWIWSVGIGSLYYLNLSFNLLEDIQKPYTSPDSLAVLDLHANLLKGEIPIPHRGAMYLDYSNNRFNTSIPSNIGGFLNSTVFFSLSNNNITGDIPESMCKATSLQLLDLSNNFLRGIIPPCLFAMAGNLTVLDLGGNKLYGPIPDTFQSNCGLRTLDLSRNNFQGRIPISLSNCKFVQVLNVGNNYLEDSFPCSLTNALNNLSVVILRSNMFHGEISCSWEDHSWPNLQILDIAYNNFSGALLPQLFLRWRRMMIDDNITETPPLGIFYYRSDTFYYLDRLKLMIKGRELDLVKILSIYKTVDFSCNKFEGKIPDAIGGLGALYTLNLSNNALTGTIPGSIGKLAQLGSLDLSTNQLTGTIPSELGNLTFLSYLNLSNNQLIGKIPEGRQLQTFSEASFLGNKELCGFPLKLSCDDLHNNGSSSPFDIHSGQNEIDWIYISAALGFSVGLGMIALFNYFSPTWWRRFIVVILQLLLKSEFRVEVQER